MSEGNANSNQARGQVYHGARGWVAVNGKLLGYCPNIGMTRNTNLAPAECLDDLEVTEHVAVGYTVSFTFAAIAVTDKTMIDRGVMVALEDILNNPTKTITIMDRPTDSAQWTLEGCSFASDSFSLAKGSITALNFSGMALRRRDKNGVRC